MNNMVLDRSRETQIITTVTDFSNSSLNEKSQTHANLLDLSEAFDKYINEG